MSFPIPISGLLLRAKNFRPWAYHQEIHFLKKNSTLVSCMGHTVPIFYINLLTISSYHLFDTNANYPCAPVPELPGAEAPVPLLWLLPVSGIQRFPLAFLLQFFWY